MYSVEKAEKYIQENRNSVDSEYRLQYHVMAPIGWINDPNGFSYYKGKYHLFYQYYPYDSKWGPMHWGHVTSEDLVNWKEEKVALAPDQEYDRNGCFSGSAIEHEGKLYLLYTGHIHTKDENGQNSTLQVQNAAVSEDGVHFRKYEKNPVIGSDKLPQNAMSKDFRDPKVWKEGDSYYMVVASLHQEEYGQILLYTSKDLLHWNFKNILLESHNTYGKMWECPDFFVLDTLEVLIVSPQYMQAQGERFLNLHSSLYFVGDMNYELGKFEPNSYYELDCGFDFYAPQTMQTPDGRRIMIAWMDMWESHFPTHEKQQGWAGAMTLPRELHVRDNKLYSVAVKEIEQFRRNEISYVRQWVREMQGFEGVKGKAIELEVSFEIGETSTGIFGLRMLAREQEYTELMYDPIEKKVILNRNQAGEGPGGTRQVKVEPKQGRMKWRIFIDTSSIEVFIQDGEYTMTARVYPNKGGEEILFFAEDPILIQELKKWDIVIES